MADRCKVKKRGYRNVTVVADNGLSFPTLMDAVECFLGRRDKNAHERLRYACDHNLPWCGHKWKTIRPEYRYFNEPLYHRMVDSLESWIRVYGMSEAECHEMVRLAASHSADRQARTAVKS